MIPVTPTIQLDPRELDESFCRDLEQCVPFDRKR